MTSTQDVSETVFKVVFGALVVTMVFLVLASGDLLVSLAVILLVVGLLASEFI